MAGPAAASAAAPAEEAAAAAWMPSERPWRCRAGSVLGDLLGAKKGVEQGKMMKTDVDVFLWS